jgi:hypothetical protein
VHRKSTDVSEEHIAFILGSKFKSSRISACKQLTRRKFGLFFEPEDGGDMFLRNVVDFRCTTRRYIPQDSTLHNHRCENLRSCMRVSCSVPTKNFDLIVTIVRLLGKHYKFLRLSVAAEWVVLLDSEGF